MPIDKAAYEGDIVSRLKNWRGLHLAHSGNLFEEAAVEMARLQHAVTDWRLEAYEQRKRVAAAEAEIAELREAIRRLADQDATLSVCDGNVTVTMDATLTDEEREAVSAASKLLAIDGYQLISAALRNLLERTK
jgi:hypothetical protein